MITLAKTVSCRLTLMRAAQFSYKNALINQTPSSFEAQKVELKDNLWRTPDPSFKKSQQTHLSNGQYLVHKTPVVYVDSSTARCMGGVQIAPGHPQVYIQLNTRNPGQPVACKYCGMRFAMRHHH